MEEVNVLILGGLTHLARPLLTFLVNRSPDEKPRVAKIRVADKHLLAGQTRTTYIDSETEAALQDARVEYRQANLNTPATASSIFKLEAGSVFDFVFDLTGEGILTTESPANVLLERTTKLAGLLASEAKANGARAYIRDTPPFWTSKPDEGAAKEGDVAKRSLPKDPRAYFYYEAERAVANIDDLPVVLLRSAAVWGPNQSEDQYYGPVSPRIALGDLYAFLQEPMKVLWSPEMRLNTLHAHDWVSAAWSSALWASSRDRAQGNAEAGERLPPLPIKEKTSAVDTDADHERCCPRAKTPVAPVLNLVDDDDTTTRKLLDVVSELFGIETGFTNAAVNAWAKVNLSGVADDINEKHVEALDKMRKQQGEGTGEAGVEGRKPCPIEVYLPVQSLVQRSIHLDGTKARKVLGAWKSNQRLDKNSVEAVVKSFKDNGAWSRNSLPVLFVELGC